MGASYNDTERAFLLRKIKEAAAGGGGGGSAVASFNGRIGAIVPQQTDYDAFFTTLAEAAAAAPVQSVNGVTGAVVTVASFNGRTGAVVPQQADYDAFFTTPAEAAAAAPVQSVNGATGAVVLPALYSRSAVLNTTSGSAIDFSGIPATAIAIDLHLRGVSLTATGNMLVQFLNTSGTAIVTGYISTSGAVNNTTGMVIASAAAGDVVSGLMRLRRFPGTQTWISSHGFKRTTGATLTGGGDVALGVDISGIRLTRTSTDTFDAGSAFVEWRS